MRRKIEEELNNIAEQELNKEYSDLQELIDSYGVNKDEESLLKKEISAQNTAIKDLMLKNSLEYYATSKYKVTYYEQNKDSMDEDALVSLFTSVPKFMSIAYEYGIVKTKEYIDMDALENAMYHYAFNQEQLDEISKHKIEKRVPVLKITKVKGKK